jgi:Dolichyl-phosphate-mannose-protein mannosyltransferase
MTLRKIKAPTAVVLVICVSVIVNSLFWLILPNQFQTNESTDYRDYYEPVSRNILKGLGITRDGALRAGQEIAEGPAIYYPPGYPFVLAAIFKAAGLLQIPEATMIAAFTLLCMAATSVLVFMLAKTVWGVAGALICSFIWITYPLNLWLIKQPNSEIPFLVVFYAAFFFLWYSLFHRSSPWLVFLVGLLAGFSMLIRPIAIGTGIVMAAILWFVTSPMESRSRSRLITILLLGNLVAIVPWQAWVYVRTGRIVPLASVGPAVVHSGLTLNLSKKLEARPQLALPQDTLDLIARIDSRSARMESLGEFVSLMKEELRSHPLAVVKLFLIKMARSWYATDSHRVDILILFIQIPYLLFAIWTSKLAWALGGLQRQLVVSVWMITMYFWLMNTVGGTIVRYMVPAIGLLFLTFPAAFSVDRQKHTATR